MNGILIVNKEANMTSQDVVTKIKRRLDLKKVGHAGTLDPMATGVLVVLLNEATKLSDYLMSDDKVYLATIAIGEATTTEDAEGEVTDTKEVTPFSHIDSVLESLLGPLEQIPPMYSSIHHQGKKLYQIARRGETVERQPRMITIHAIKRTNEVSYRDGKAYFSFEVKASKGTYIRTLCVEIGERLGYPAHMHHLTRLQSGPFHLNTAYTLDDITKGNYTVVPMLEALKDMAIIQVNLEQKQMIFHGKRLVLPIEDAIVALAEGDCLLAIYEKDNETYKARRVWN